MREPGQECPDCGRAMYGSKCKGCGWGSATQASTGAYDECGKCKGAKGGKVAYLNGRYICAECSCWICPVCGTAQSSPVGMAGNYRMCQGCHQRWLRNELQGFPRLVCGGEVAHSQCEVIDCPCPGCEAVVATSRRAFRRYGEIILRNMTEPTKRREVEVIEPQWDDQDRFDRKRLEELQRFSEHVQARKEESF